MFYDESIRYEEHDCCENCFCLYFDKDTNEYKCCCVDSEYYRKKIERIFLKTRKCENYM